MKEAPYDMEGFTGVRTEAWRQKIEAELKKAGAETDLSWQSPEGIKVKPFYNRDDWEQPLPHCFRISLDWHSGAYFPIEEEGEANRELLEALNYGISAPCLVLHEPKDYAQAFKGVHFDCIETHLDFESLAPTERDAVTAQLLRQRSREADLDVFLNLDPIGHLLRTGCWAKGEEADFEEVSRNLKRAPKAFHMLCVQAALYQNAGSTITEQLAYALSHAYEYLSRYGKQLRKLHLQLAVDSNYFFEIAKLRALRLLWRSLGKELRLDTTLHLSVIPTLRNKSFLDAYNNALRTTAETLAAVTGGADTVFNLPYDSFFKKPNAHADRMARNLQLLLREEASIGRVSDPARGSFYIEKLTRALAQGALKQFKAIARSGGFLENVKAGRIQAACARSHKAEQERFEAGQIHLIGVNQYPNPQEKPEVEIEPFYAPPEDAAVEPIHPHRLAESLEKRFL